MTPSLSDTFEPPSTTTYGRSGSSVSRRSTSTSASDQAAGRVRQQLRDVVDARVLAVHDAEAVVDVRVGRARRAASANAPRSASSLLVSPGVEPQVLQQRDVAVGRAPATVAVRRLADRVGGEARPARRAARTSRAATGASEYFGSGAPLGGRGARRRRRARPRRAERSIVGSDARIAAVVGDRGVAVAAGR